jgi:hypothetical protein
MATVQRFNDIVAVTGTDVLRQKNDGGMTLNRGVVRDALYNANNPLGDVRGKFDFIVCFTIGSSVVDHKGADHNLRPRPLRGIVQLPGYFTDRALSQVPSIMGWFNHECGHHWLVPVPRIQTPDGEVPAARIWRINAALGAGDPLPPYPIMGRDNNHWSPYVEADNSCMEGNGFAEVQNSWGKDHARGKPIEGVPYDFQGTTHDSGCRYGDPDLFFMGALNDSNTNLQQKKLGYIQPEWVVPLDFQSGLYVEMDDGHRWYFGFDEGPQTIHAEAVDPAAPTVSKDAKQYVVSDPYNHYDQIGLRMVQMNGSVALQFRVWGLRYVGCLVAPIRRIMSFLPWPGGNPFALVRPVVNVDDVFQDLADNQMETVEDPRTGWRTYTVLPGKAVRTGLSSRTKTTTPVYSRISSKLGAWSGSGIISIATGDLTWEFPKTGPFLTANERFIMPFHHGEKLMSYQETDTLSEAPKLIWDVAENVPEVRRDSFAFGGLVGLESCLFVTHAGGAGRKKTIIGDYQEVPYADLVLPWSAEERQVHQDPPLGGHYRTLVCLVTQDPANVTQPRRDFVDLARQHWEPAFYAMTKQHRVMYTAIDPL